MPSSEKKVLIVGAGVAGLSAGIYARLNGYDAEIVEMHTVPGGQCTAWERKGYRFDYCLHWLVGTASGPFHEVWHETGALSGDVQVVDPDIHVKFVDESGQSMYVYTDLERWEAHLRDIAPEDGRAIARMCADMRKSVKLDPFRDPPQLRNPFQYLRALWRQGPALQLMMKYGKMDCRAYFDRLGLRNARLRHFLDSLYGDMDLSALAFLLMLAWFGQKNAGYPIGGSLPFATRMADRFRDLGGVLSLGRKVEQILVENGRATGLQLSDGSRIAGDYVISAADGHATLYDMLGGRYLTRQHREAYETWKLFTPLVQVSFGLKRAVPADAINTMYRAPGTRIGCTVLKSGYSLMNYAFDRTMAPEGRSVLVLRYDSPWELWEHMDPKAYKAEKKRIEADARALLETRIPGIGADVDVVDVATPLSGVKYTGVWRGAYEGFLPAAGNLMKALPMTLPGLEGFYQIGQWLFPGGGLPPSAQSGRWVVQLMCRNDGRKFRSHMP
jgi:phytoene dehydrogenase-like protein